MLNKPTRRFVPHAARYPTTNSSPVIATPPVNQTCTSRRQVDTDIEFAVPTKLNQRFFKCRIDFSWGDVLMWHAAKICGCLAQPD